MSKATAAIARSGMLAIVLVLAGCVAGPDFTPPAADAPQDWTTWRGATPALPTPAIAPGAPDAQWWRAFGDPVLDSLAQQVLQSGPDVRVSMLRFAQARVQRQTVAAQRGPQAGINAQAVRQRGSESGASTRILDITAPGNRDTLARSLAEPFTLYQAGFDASWELDLWGRVARSIEAADADAAGSAALLDAARLSVVSELARNYFELRTTQHQLALARQDIVVLEKSLALVRGREGGGLATGFDAERQRSLLADARGRLPELLRGEAEGMNRISLLLGEAPGALAKTLQAPARPSSTAALPDLKLGLPSEVALRRPDIRAALARLHSATAQVGVAEAALYPSIRIGAQFGYSTYESGKFGEWGARTWSIGPSLDLPIFDHGRRRAVVTLRELAQQEAAVNYQRTVLKAWAEIDNALNAYAAARARQHQREEALASASRAHAWAQSRYRGGLSDFTDVLLAQRQLLQARRDHAAGLGEVRTHYVAIYKAIGGGGAPPA